MLQFRILQLHRCDDLGHRRRTTDRCEQSYGQPVSQLVSSTALLRKGEIDFTAPRNVDCLGLWLRPFVPSHHGVLAIGDIIDFEISYRVGLSEIRRRTYHYEA